MKGKAREVEGERKTKREFGKMGVKPEGEDVGQVGGQGFI